MWIITNRGPLSVVRDRNSDNLLVRARQRETIVAILGPYGDVFEDQSADYPFRAWVTPKNFEAVMATEFRRINYPNFKDSVADRVLAGLYSKVWSILSVLGTGQNYGRPLRSAVPMDVWEFEGLPPSAFEEDGSFRDDDGFARVAIDNQSEADVKDPFDINQEIAIDYSEGDKETTT